MKKNYFLFAFVLIFFFEKNLFSQVLINEVSNGSVLIDENNENNDWIELYNSGSSSVNLLNYAITDDSTKLKKWTFPDVIIEPNSFAIIFASGKDVKAGNMLHTNFKIKSTGEKIVLCNGNGKIIDQFYLGQLQYNHSSGRKPDGGVDICLFKDPTPGITNNNSACYDGYEPAPMFSINAGFYPTSQSVELYSPSPTGIVKYSLDGNVPSISSNLYSSAISINNTMVVSAICYSSGNRLPSKVVKRTYFIDDSDFDLPVFSITMNPDDLFDSTTGIYVNYQQDWEKVCYIEFFDKQKNKQFELAAGIKIQGNYSRTQEQKSFRILTRKEYGTAWLDYPLIPEKPETKSYKRFNLRNGGSDYHYTRFRDAFMQRILKDSPVDRMGYEPAIVFLNGEYWGQYEIREQHNTKYLLTTHGIPEDKVDILYHKGTTVRASAGSVNQFHTMYDHITKNDPVKTDFYKSANEKLDLENFTDYLIAGIYYSNRDWIDHTAPANNIRLYKEHRHDGKWKYMYWDLDMGSGLYDKPTDIVNNLAMVHNPDEANVHSDIFRSLLLNTQFKHYFVNRYADLMNTVFQYSNIKSLAYEMRDSIDSSVDRHQEKWGKDYSWWYDSVERLIDWHKRRMPYARQHLNDEFNLNGQVNVTLATFPPDAGRIKISTIVPDSLPWKGVYYNGVPVTISAIPNPGFTFDHWASNDNMSVPDYNESITLDIGSDDTFTAHFIGAATEPKITFSEINYHSAAETDAGDWLEVYNYGDISVNLTGWYINNGNIANLYQIPFGTVIPANGYLVLSADTQKFISQYPFVTNFKGQLPFNFANSSEQISLLDYDYKTVLSVTYSDANPWPSEADGKGKTLELKDPATSLDLASNWFAGCPGGSPGIKYNMKCITGIKDAVANNSFRLQIGPNPSNNLIKIKVVSNKENIRDITFSMYDFTGNEIKQISSFNNNEIIISRDEFSPGIYIVKIGNAESFITEKIIFQ